MNYFINYMLKHHPSELTKQMLGDADKYLNLLRKGKTISLWSGCYLKMVAGRIKTIDEEMYE